MRVEKVSGSKLVSNTIWKLFESIGSQIILFVISIILARLLSPSDYGLMAMVTIVITFLGIFINSGVCSYIIYIEDIKKQDFLTAMLLNVGLSVAIFIILFSCSDLIADFYSEPRLSILIKVTSVVLPFNAVCAVYNAYAMKMSLFKMLFLRNLFVLPISGILALSFAYLGFGVWALIIQQLASSILLTIIFVIAIKIRIDGSWRFNANEVPPMLNFGGFTLLSTIIAYIGDNVSDVLIGKRLDSAQLGFYSRGAHIPYTFVNVITSVLAGVLFPAFSSYRSDKQEFKEKFRKTIRLMYSVILPFFFCLAACLKPMVIVLLTEKWERSIGVAQVFCLYSCAFPFIQAASQVYLASGHVKIRTACEIIKTIMIISLLSMFIDDGILAVSYVRLSVNMLLVIFVMIINKKLMDYLYIEFICDLLKPLLFALLMFVCVYAINLIDISYGFILISQIIMGCVLYFVCIKLFKMTELEELLSVVISKYKIKRLA